MNTGDFVYINYVGRVKDTGEIFDLTKEDVAKNEGLYSEKFKYGPIAVIIDSDLILPGLNGELKKMKIGEKKTVEIKPENAFGERNPDLVRLIPEAKFKEQDIDVAPGKFVTINRVKGRVVSVDGGRVNIDFNHPLAGKILEYDLEIVEEIKDQNEKIKALVNYFAGTDKEDIDIAVTGSETEIKFKKRFDLLVDVKELIAKNILKWVSSIEKVKFSEVFENK